MRDQNLYISEIELDVIEEEKSIDEYSSKFKLGCLYEYVNRLQNGSEYDTVIEDIDAIVLHITFPTFNGLKKDFTVENVYSEIISITKLYP